MTTSAIVNGIRLYVGVQELDGLWCEVALSVSKCLGKVVIFVARSVVVVGSWLLDELVIGREHDEGSISMTGGTLFLWECHQM